MTSPSLPFGIEEPPRRIVCENGLCGECDDCRSEAPAPTMHLRSRCQWRASTGGQCELEPHGADIPHRVTLWNGGLLVAYTQNNPTPEDQISSLSTRVAQLERESAQALASIQEVIARVDAVEHAENCDGCRATVASDIATAMEHAHRALSAAGVDGADERGEDLSLAERVVLLANSRDAARVSLAEAVVMRDAAASKCLAAIQAGDALRIECDALTEQVAELTARLERAK